jgi:hypothetical protein
MKGFVTVIGLLALAAGCGDDGGGMGNGESNLGFVTPEEATTAWSEENGVWVEQGAANWGCLGTPSSDSATTVEVTLSGKIDDFQTGNIVPNAEIKVFDGADVNNPFATATADANGDYTMTIPAGHTRLGFELNADGQFRTLLLNQYLDPNEATQTLDMSSVSELTTNALPAFIGVTRTAGRGVLAGAMRDCDDNEVSGAVATVSSVAGAPMHLQDDPSCDEDKPCTQTYYFSAGSTSLPVRHSQQINTNSDGLFMTIELPVAASAFLQVWGYTDAGSVGGDMTLLAEIPSPVLADTVVTFSLEPLRTN